MKKFLTNYFTVLITIIATLLVLLACGIQGLSIFFYIWYWTLFASLALILIAVAIEEFKHFMNK